MANDDTKPEDEKVATDAPAEATDKPKDAKAEVEEAVKKGKSRVKEAYKVAMEKSFGTTWTEKLQFWKWPKNAPLFIGNFFKELFAVKKEEEETKEQAESEIAQEVVKGSETFDIAENLAEEMDKDAHFEPEEKAAVATLTEDVLESAKATGEPAKVLATIDRVKESAEKDEKDPKAITDAEMRRSFSMGLFTMVRLRQRFGTEKELADFLTRVKSASGRSRKFTNFSKYITNNFKSLFEFEAGTVPNLLGYGWVEKGGLAAKLLGSDDRMSDGLDAILPDLFPNAVRDKGLVPLRKYFVRFMRKKRYPDPNAIAELIFMISGSEKHIDDLRTLAKRIGGAKVVSLASVKDTEDRKAKAKKERSEKAVAKKDEKKADDKAGPTKSPDHKEKEPKQAS